MTRRKDWMLLVSIALAITILLGGLVERGPLRQAENWFSDLRLALMTPRRSPPESLALLTISEETLTQFPYRSPVNRYFLARLIDVLNAKGARAIGLDILLDRPTETAADQSLLYALRNSRIPVVLAYADSEHLSLKQQQFLDTFTTDLHRGYINLLLDGADGVVRQIFPGRVAPDGRFTLGFAAALAELAGAAPPTQPLPLRYRGPPPAAALDDLNSVFKHYPAHLAEVLPATWLAGKIVLIGAELSASAEDMKKTPFAALLGNQQGLLPGVMVHAHSLAQLLEGESPTAPTLGLILGLYLATAGVGIVLTRLDWPAWATLGLTLALLVVFWVFNFWQYRQSNAAWPLLGPSLTLLSTTWWALAYASRQERRQKRFIKSAFARYLHPDWVEQLIAHPDLLQLQGERRELTLLFSDIANFTTISERLPPEALVEVLRRYLEGMTRIIIDNGGAVNQYMGDGIMALFGAPTAQPDHALRAVRCALALDRFAEDFRRTATLTDQQGQAVAFGQTRIGVHSGEATVGNFGSMDKLEYTAIGDAVNAASRLEGLNSHFGTHIAVSGTTRSLALRDTRPGELWFRPMAQVVVKGKQQALDVFEPLAASDAAVTLMEEYTAAYALLKTGDHQAEAAFAALRARYPADPLLDFHQRRIETGEWTTCVTLLSK